MILGEVGGWPLWSTRYYILLIHEEALWIIAIVKLVFKRGYRHEGDLWIITRVTQVFKIQYMQNSLNQKKLLMKDRVIFMHEGFLRKTRRSIRVPEEGNQLYSLWIYHKVCKCNKYWVGRILITNVHENGEKSFWRNGLKLKPFYRNHLDHTMVSNWNRSVGILLTTQ